MIEKPFNQNKSEECGNNNEQFKTITQYNTLNQRELMRNQNNNFRLQNNCSIFHKRVQNNFDRRNHFDNKNLSR